MVVLALAGFTAVVTAAPAPVDDVNASTDVLKRLTTLERVMSAKNSSQHRMQSQLETVQDEVDGLRGTLEAHSHKLEQMLQRQRELYAEIDRLSSLAGSITPNAAPVIGEPAAIVGEPQTNGVILEQAKDEKVAYQDAVNLVIKDKQYDDAVPAFESFLATYPNSEFSPNAHYWLGQLRFNRQDWKSAQYHFSTVVNQYPESSKRPYSMLKLGEALTKLGNKAQAQTWFEELQNNYPDSSAKKIADSRLRQLKQGN
jgi:tol-pal system protein YbgF